MGIAARETDLPLRGRQMGLISVPTRAERQGEQANQLIRNELWATSAREQRCSRWQAHCKQDVVGTHVRPRGTGLGEISQREKSYGTYIRGYYTVGAQRHVRRWGEPLDGDA